MDTAEILVIIGGVALIGLTLWYFFGEREKVAAETNETGVQEIKVTVKGGYAPDVIVVKKDVPVRLNFYRDETSSCSEQVVFGDFGIARDLPAFKTTPIEFTPEETGEFIGIAAFRRLRLGANVPVSRHPGESRDPGFPHRIPSQARNESVIPETVETCLRIC